MQEVLNKNLVSEWMTGTKGVGKCFMNCKAVCSYVVVMIMMRWGWEKSPCAGFSFVSPVALELIQEFKVK